MFEETGCVPDVDGKKVRAEKIVPRAKQYILETIDNPKACYDATILRTLIYTCPRTNESYASIGPEMS